ncbi:MAG: response regulator [Elusimicrobia bacterium]|nr:response regulator [Elusimicrobiota bacterium]
MTTCRILVIDDEPAFHDILSQSLEARGFEVAHAYDGASGLAALAAGDAHAVILDLSMPSMDGFEVCRRIRSDPALAETPVLMLTVRSMERDILAGLDIGADAYVAKPFDPDALALRLRALIERSRT